MPYCKLPDKTKLYFETYGAELDLSASETLIKPTIIVSHGGPNADHTFHVPFFKHLANIAQVIFYDHRGCGRSDGENPEQWNLVQWAKDLHDFCQALNIKKPYIAGVSFGGWVAMQYATLYPSENYAGLMLLDTEAFFDLDIKIEDYQKAKNDPQLREIVYNYYKNPSPENNLLFTEYCVPLFTQRPFPFELSQHCLVRENMEPHFKLNVAPFYNLLPELSKISVPVLYVTGTTNPHHSAASAERSASAFSNTEVELHLLKDTGFSTIDAPEKVLAIIRQFINQHKVQQNSS